jgi:hypothetical protein
MALIERQSGEEVLGGAMFAPDIYGKGLFKKLRSGVGKFAKKAAKVYTAPVRTALKLTTAPQRALVQKARRKKFKLLGTGATWNDVLMGASLTWEEAAAMHGIDMTETMGATIFSKIVKKIGKVTSPITTAIAKKFLPASVVNAAAKLDPTKKGLVTPNAVAAVKELVKAKEAETPAITALAPTASAIQKNAIMNTLKNPLVIGALVVGGGIIVLMLTKKKRR